MRCLKFLLDCRLDTNTFKTIQMHTFYRRCQSGRLPGRLWNLKPQKHAGGKKKLSWIKPQEWRWWAPGSQHMTPSTHPVPSRCSPGLLLWPLRWLQSEEQNPCSITRMSWTVIPISLPFHPTPSWAPHPHHSGTESKPDSVIPQSPGQHDRPFRTHSILCLFLDLSFQNSFCFHYFHGKSEVSASLKRINLLHKSLGKPETNIYSMYLKKRNHWFNRRCWEN